METMKRITHDEYSKLVSRNNEVVVANKSIFLPKKWNITTFAPSDCNLNPKTTIWSFPQRGNWATHNGKYRGNWSPIIPRNLILRYTEKGDTVLDQMVGSGTTLIECKLLGRNGIGVDINPASIMVARNRIDFEYHSGNSKDNISKIQTYVGDAKNLSLIDSNSVDLIATHPPYANIISYSGGKLADDISNINDVNEFEKNIKEVAKECFRVLKPNKICAILIGDTRRHKHYVPLSSRLMQTFLDVGFILKEDIIKHQWNTTSGYGDWNSKAKDFYLIAHEHLFIFRKPKENEDLNKFKGSIKWW
ncbi:TRM11 family SAM-dependent methyltransferase [Methanolobus bombayensis]|jgi:DNA modification methylase|uniref:TRM11 family SAM-dependent methyltransferase n=1 Tax=Methanolobus bombayensis TaxID=38023 RepID=UPI001AE63380|nr:DNA methyltransferase [Methanolobus bombayensis]MBP1910731.1 DNA modification methylase [Methanolobus bombayensis]